METKPQSSSREPAAENRASLCDSLRETQLRVLERVATGANPQEIYRQVIELIEEQIPGGRPAIMLLDDDGRTLRHGCSSGLPESIWEEAGPFEVGPERGSCGAAVFFGRSVVLRDIETDPLGRRVREAVRPHGLSACWSEPIFSTGGQVLGTLAIYHPDPCEPEEAHLRVMRVAAHLLGVVVERHRREVARDEMEKRLIEAQKLESLGVLAGGIAHDFNNLLTGVLGYAGLIRRELPPGSSLEELVNGVENSAMRAAELCKQMLAYAGRGRFVIESVDLSGLVRESERLLRMSIGTKAALGLELGGDLPRVEGDAAQLRQVLIGLVANASESLGPQGGLITVATGLVRVDGDYFNGAHLSPKLPAGAYVYLDVTDTGCGMDADTRARIFDPFFSTKFTGRGLGLAAALGIVRSHKGALKVRSAPGEGSSFRLLLPAREAGGASAAAARDRGKATGGKVLVVDDEETVRMVAADMVEALGFEVLTAADGEDGVEKLRARLPEIALVLLDLTMPRMTGEEAFREMRRVRPDIPVVLMSGFTEQEATSHFAGTRPAGFLQKPFSLEMLKARLDEALAACA